MWRALLLASSLPPRPLAPDCTFCLLALSVVVVVAACAVCSAAASVDAAAAAAAAAVMMVFPHHHALRIFGFSDFLSAVF